VVGHTGIVQGYQTYAFSTRNGARRLVMTANASNSRQVLNTMAGGLDVVFYGTKATRPSQPVERDLRE
jgi:D-alanyl-D-alanine carboxypeptidase